MAAYIIADVQVTDSAGFQAYQNLVGATLAPYGGKFVVRAGRSEVLEGDYQPHRLVMLEFPSYDQAKQWYESQAYADLIPQRQRTSQASIILMEGMA